MLLSIAFVSDASLTAAGSARHVAACASPAYRQFDFWLGNWDVVDAKGHSQVAQVRVSSILGGCVLLEEYHGADGTEGRSFSVYDASRDIWHQSWVTNRGQMLVLEGHYHDGQMELAGTDRAEAGASERAVRGTWRATAGGVREVALRSTDGKKTWQPWFDLLFRPHAG